MSLNLKEKDVKEQSNLKRIIQENSSPSNFEKYVASLLGKLLNTSIYIAKSGFQYGADSGPAGRHGRKFRIECKKYSDKTSLSNRELLGEIDHAVARDNALEAWILVATREVPEQLAMDLMRKGEEVGVPIVIFDWSDTSLSALAALSATFPDLVEQYLGLEAKGCADSLEESVSEKVEEIKQDLQSWSLGFDNLRKQSIGKIGDIWRSGKISQAELGQDVAGGEENKKIKRNQIQNALNNEWVKEGASKDLISVTGYEGVGKTWAVVEWLIDSKNQQPITLIIPSSAAAELRSPSALTVKRFLAGRLYELTEVRDHEHWARRLDRLLVRPIEEGSIFTILIDGLNQEPSVPWVRILQILQGPPFEGRVRVILTMRRHFYEEKIFSLRSLKSVQLDVDIYDVEPGGEFDQMLHLEGVRREDLHPDLVEIARTPRLFKLVMCYREQLVDANQITVHRLLWEYGRDSLGIRDERAFSESEWKDWLREVAKKYRDGVKTYSLKQLGDMTDQPDLDGNDVYLRLSEIIDGRFAQSDVMGNLKLSPIVVYHALAVGLLSHLAVCLDSDFYTIEKELLEWLDPISALDERSEILRAAVSIAIELELFLSSNIPSVLLTSWLQSQNLSDHHRHEVKNLAECLLTPLLDVIEHSIAALHTSSRLWAIEAIGSISRSNTRTLDIIVERVRNWFCIISRKLELNRDRNQDQENRRSKHFISRVGKDVSGNISVLGLPLEFVDHHNGVLQNIIPTLLDRFPLARALPVFEAAAVANAVSSGYSGWDALRWVVLLNDKDSLVVCDELERLSERVQGRNLELEINSGLPNRVGALLLWLTGVEENAVLANNINPEEFCVYSYARDYLDSPAKGIFALERRHAEDVMIDNDVSLHLRCRRLKALMFDPDIRLHDDFVQDVCRDARLIDVNTLNRGVSRTIEDHRFQEFEPVLARCSPDLLKKIHVDKIENFSVTLPEFRYWSALCSTEQYLLFGRDELPSVNILRELSTESDPSNESHASAQLLILEIRNLNALDQITKIIDAELKYISLDLFSVLNIPTDSQMGKLLDLYENATDKNQNALLCILAELSVSVTDRVWLWVEKKAFLEGEVSKNIAFQILSQSDMVRFGRILFDRKWSWSADNKLFGSNHYGSGALIQATVSVPFDQIVANIAPWRLLEAVRRRGSVPLEIRVATVIIDNIIRENTVDYFDISSSLVIECEGVDSDPGSFVIYPSIGEGDEEASASLMFDDDARLDAQRNAVDLAVKHVAAARNSGAKLYLMYMDAEDLVQVVLHAPEYIKKWLEGLEENSSEFNRRVSLSDGVYLALCEALLTHDPQTGALVWRYLQKNMRVRYRGYADIEELTHIVFRAPNSEVVIELRSELLELENCNTDRELYNVAVAACLNNKSDWLSDKIAIDRKSHYTWRKRRAIVFSGFSSFCTLPVDDAWPSGELSSEFDELRKASARYRWSEACARHWWTVFLNEDDCAKAYAAWVLFLRTVDYRAYVWWKKESIIDSTLPLYEIKKAHIDVNSDELKRAMRKNVEDLEKKFLGKRTSQNIYPWANR